MKAIVSVQEKFSIRPPGVKKPELLQRAATVQPSPRPQTPKPSAFRKSMNGSMPPPPATDRTRELDTFKTWAQDAITKQKMDIACVSTAVERIETGMRGFQDFMNQVRTELAANRGENPTQKDIMALRDDVRDLRKEFGTNQQTQQSKPQEHAKIFDQKLATLQDHVYSLGESAVTKEHLEVLIDDIQRVYQKTSYLQEDLGVLKRKHRIMETISSKTRLTPNQDSVDQEAGVSSEDVFPRSSDAVIDLTAGDDFVDPIAPEYSTSHSQDKPIAADSTTSRTIDSTPFTRGGEEVMTRPLREEQGSGKLKRKHNNADDSPAQSEPLTKRTRKSLGQPIKEHVPLSTSNGDSLPIPNNPAIAQLKGRKGMRPVSLGNPAKGPVRSAGRPRTMSLANTPTNLLAAPEQPLSLPNFESQPPNLSVPKQRGSATTAAATSSNQSLRQKRRSGNKENEVPDSSSHTVLDSDSPSEYITTATPIPMNDTPVPSIERDSFAIVIPVSKELDRQTRQGGNSRIFEASRALFVCHFCGKEYKHAGSLKTVSTTHIKHGKLICSFIC